MDVRLDAHMLMCNVGRLPTSGHGLPITYQLSESGKQYVVIAAGGHAAMGTPPGDYLIAFTLPDKS